MSWRSLVAHSCIYNSIGAEPSPRVWKVVNRISIMSITIGMGGYVVRSGSSNS